MADPGGTGLLAAFPLAFSVIIPAMYFPILLMLLGLIFRGVAFEFRLKATSGRHWWDRVVLRGLRGRHVSRRAWCSANSFRASPYPAGILQARSFDWVRPFPLATGAGLLFGYGLLGATWLVMKTEGDLQE